MVAPQAGWIGVTRIPGHAGTLIHVLQFMNSAGFDPRQWRKIWREAGFEHAFVYTQAQLEGGEGIVEAEPGGAVHVPFHYDPAQVHWIIPPDEYTGISTALAACALIGTPYSFLDYLAIALRRLRMPCPGLRSYIKSSKHAICSQLADRAALTAGWHLFADGRAEGDVTPLDLDILAGFYRNH